MTKILNLLFIFLLVSCVKLTATGVIETTEDVTLSKSRKKNRVKFDANGNVIKIKKPLTIPAGTYEAELKIRSKKSVEIIITRKFPRGKKTRDTIQIKMDKGQLPNDGGDFSFTAQQVRQPYNVAGNVKATRNQTSQTSTRESCTYRTQEYRCRTRYERRCTTDRRDRRTCRSVPRQVCRYETVTRRGRQDVTFHHVNTKRDFHINFLTLDTNSAVMTFDGSHTERKKVYDYRGNCNH